MTTNMPIVDDFMYTLKVGTRREAQDIWDCMTAEGREEAHRRLCDIGAERERRNWFGRYDNLQEVQP